MSLEECDVIKVYGTKVVGGNIVGFLLGLTTTILASMVTCCGKMIEKAKLIGGIAVGMGLFCFIIPAIVGAVAGAGTIDQICDDAKCNGGATKCTDADREKYKADFAAIGVFVSYLAYGWLDIIIGIVSLSLGGAACCGCCKAKAPEPAQAQQVVVVQQPGVVQAVAAQPVVMAKA